VTELSQKASVRWARIFAIALLLGTVSGGESAAQSTSIKIRLWQLVLGTPVTELLPQYLDPHCGTNGGPPSTRLANWSAYAACPPDRATGLHEIWFTEDDETEYVGRAYRALGFDPGPASANVLFNHKVIYSLLVDDDGLVQGYRAFTDPRESTDYRYDAEFVGEALRNVYGYSAFTCTDFAAEEGQNPVDGRFVNQTCVAVTNGLHITIDRRFFRKPGQLVFDPVTRRATEGYFESSTRLEVIAADLVPGP
jgi:hypothetical protein